MNYTIKTLESKFKIKYQTLAVYLSRAEFSHIKKEVGKVAEREVVYLNNVTNNDLKRLEQLISTRRAKSRKPSQFIKKEITLEEAKRILRKIRRILKTDKNDVIKNIEIENELYKIDKYL